jgi:hypothetical protein
LAARIQRINVFHISGLAKNDLPAWFDPDVSGYQAPPPRVRSRHC